MRLKVTRPRLPRREQNAERPGHPPRVGDDAQQPPEVTHLDKATRRRVARRVRKEHAASRADAPRVARGQKRRDRVDALRQRAASIRISATGRHYERIGFTTRTRRALAYVLLACVLTCVAWMSWDGEHDWARHRLGWRDPQALLVPGALDIAGMYCALRGLDLIDKGESAIGHRVMAAVFVALGAWINWRNELPTGDVTREAFFPIMTVMAYAMIHFEMQAARREARRRQHGETSRERPKPLPRFGALAWVPGLGDPAMAFDAIREAVRERLAQALAAAVRAGEETHGTDAGDDPGDGEETHDDPGDASGPDLTQLSKADAVRWTLTHISGEPFIAARHLQTHGYPGLRSSYVSDVKRRDADRLAKTLAADAATQPVSPASGGASS